MPQSPCSTHTYVHRHAAFTDTYKHRHIRSQTRCGGGAAVAEGVQRAGTRHGIFTRCRRGAPPLHRAPSHLNAHPHNAASPLSGSAPSPLASDTQRCHRAIQTPANNSTTKPVSPPPPPPCRPLCATHDVPITPQMADASPVAWPRPCRSLIPAAAKHRRGHAPPAQRPRHRRHQLADLAFGLRHRGRRLLSAHKRHLFRDPVLQGLDL